MSNSYTKYLTISGMSCGACQKVIERRFSKIDGVHKVKVSVNEGKAEVQTEKDISLNDFQNTLEGTYYQITNLN